MSKTNPFARPSPWIYGEEDESDDTPVSSDARIAEISRNHAAEHEASIADGLARIDRTFRICRTPKQPGDVEIVGDGRAAHTYDRRAA